MIGCVPGRPDIKGDSRPCNALTGLIGIQAGDANATVASIAPVLGGPVGAGGLVGLTMCSANLPDKIAIAVDTQMDDGVPLTGNVRGQLNSAGPNPDIAQSAATAYSETGSNTYTICRSF